MNTIAQALHAAAAGLPGDTARIDAELLLARALARDRAWLYAHADDAMPENEQSAFAQLLARRRRGEPVAQILGRREFWSLDLAVTGDTLIPRPETELLVELALARIDKERVMNVLDLGTGTGAIALAIAKECPNAQVTAVDASASALAVAQKNAARLGLDRVLFLRSDWYSAVVGERYDLIVSNPPYLAETDPHLGEGDLRFEPRTALASGHDGLDAIRTIIRGATAHMNPGAWLLLEHGLTQGAAVRELLATNGFAAIETACDLEQRERVTVGQFR